MKTQFLKTTVPFAFTALMGIAGALFTTSMQTASKAAAPKIGYINGATACSVPVQCNDSDGPACEANNQQAYGKDDNCTEFLSRPL